MKWILADHDADSASRLAEEASIHPLIARLLVSRGVSAAAGARSFLFPDRSSLTSPLVFTGMEASVSRIRDAINSREQIVIYGDYDVDGVTGSAILYHTLRELGASVRSYIPDRITEGYGLNKTALGSLARSGVRLVITVDCGITAVDEATAARNLGLDLIITDHHESALIKGSGGPACAGLPAAFSVLHPACLSPDLPASTQEDLRNLTGAGVAFKLAQALLGADPADPRISQYLDLVTLGTVADMGRLTGENRVLVKHGLERLSSDGPGLRPGIVALKEVANLVGRRVTAGTVGFGLAPRINASGRLDRADTAFQLLTTSDLDEARRLAESLDEVNRQRQAMEEEIWTEARELCLQANLRGTGAFVLASESWHPGVIGIVASRIVDEFYRPTALISLKDGVGKGSARSIPGFDLYGGLSRCSALLKGFGGHKYAAGLTVAEDRISELRGCLSDAVLDSLDAEGFVRKLTVDVPVTFSDLTLDLLRDLERMEPFGLGNPEPRFGAKHLEVQSLRSVGNGNRHLKMRLRQNGISLDAIAYGKAESMGEMLRNGCRIAAVFTPKINAWNGSVCIQLEIKDVKVEKN